MTALTLSRLARLSTFFMNSSMALLKICLGWLANGMIFLMKFCCKVSGGAYVISLLGGAYGGSLLGGFVSDG